ncbi:MAG TPA: hypothetical protein DEQ03_08305, partial [Marinilabiliales bacterium]|nr:hypothetical protein [Marinilabiliales bacterium]
MNQPLLSVVVPTKRSRLDELSRQAIASALSIASPNIEIVLHVDDDLQGNQHAIDVPTFAATFQDSRIRWFLNPEPLTMTQNWEMAIGRATGEYLIIIGDDDSIRPEVLQFAEWAKKHNLDNVLGNGNVQYYWPSYPAIKNAGTV